MPSPGTDEFVWRLLELMAPMVNRAKERRERLENIQKIMSIRLQAEDPEVGFGTSFVISVEDV